ncbi:MAG: hypothetical protein R3C02_17155 [Planctomycetaceae bacterium]
MSVRVAQAVLVDAPGMLIMCGNEFGRIDQYGILLVHFEVDERGENVVTRHRERSKSPSDFIAMVTWIKPDEDMGLEAQCRASQASLP